MNVAEGDMGGELDPHGATGNGNPVGGNVTSNVSGEDVHYEEWMKWVFPLKEVEKWLTPLATWQQTNSVFEYVLPKTVLIPLLLNVNIHLMRWVVNGSCQESESFFSLPYRLARNPWDSSLPCILSCWLPSPSLPHPHLVTSKLDFLPHRSPSAS
jgi:hypothetical protein